MIDHFQQVECSQQLNSSDALKESSSGQTNSAADSTLQSNVYTTTGRAAGCILKWWTIFSMGSLTGNWSWLTFWRRPARDKRTAPHIRLWNQTYTWVVLYCSVYHFAQAKLCMPSKMMHVFQEPQSVSKQHSSVWISVPKTIPQIKIVQVQKSPLQLKVIHAVDYSFAKLPMMKAWLHNVAVGWNFPPTGDFCSGQIPKAWLQQERGGLVSWPMYTASKGGETSGMDKMYKFPQGDPYNALQKKVKEQEEIVGLHRLSRLQPCLASGSNLAAMSFRAGAVVRPAVPAVQRMLVASTLQRLREEASVCTVQFVCKTDTEICEIVDWAKSWRRR